MNDLKIKMMSSMEIEQSKRDVENATTVKQQKKNILVAAVLAVTNHRSQIGAARTSSTRTGRGNRMPQLGTGNVQFNKLKADELTASDELKESENNLKTMVDALEEKNKEFEEWQNKINLWTMDDFFDYATQSIIQPGINKYNNLFNNPRGDHYAIKKAMYACRLFNPFFIKSNNIQTLSSLVDNLNYFGKGFSEVFEGNNFLDGIKKEIEYVKRLADIEFDWENIDESRQYKQRQNRKKQREKKRLSLIQNDVGINDVYGDNDGRINDYDDWKEDPGELARRIYGWWCVQYKLCPKKIYYFTLALRLVVLVQTSSCSVERIFSQLQYIRRVCGHAVLESTLELRCQMRYQRGKGIDFG
jgi:hypothetical protein